MTRILAACLTCLLPAAAWAAEPEHLSTHGAWSVFVAGTGSSRICYIGALPEKSSGNYTQRGPTSLSVSQRPGEDAFDVVQVLAGYTYKARSEVTVTIGNDTFTLFTVDDSAWARDARTDASLVRAMRAGLEMVVKGTSSRGTLTTDTYSLKGVTAARQASRAACGL